LISLPVRLDVYRDGLRAEELFCQTRYEEAIEAGDRALAKDPEYVAALHLNGVSYAHSGRNEAADSVFSQLVPLRDRMTTSERAMHDYQIAYLHGDASGAERAIEEAYRIAPTVWGYIANNEMNQQRRHEEALVRLLSVDLDLPCNWPGWWTGAASTYHHLGRYEEEREVVRRGLERLRDHVGLMAVEAGTLAATGRLEAVDSVLDRMALLPSPPNFDSNMQAVWVGLELRAHGHPEAAEAAFERSLAAFRALPPDQDRSNRGTVLYYAGRWADADTLFAALVEESPRNVNYRGFRGATLTRLGRRAEALEIDRWLAAVPERPGLRGSNRAWRARIAAILGERDAAVRHLRDALDHRFSYGVFVHRDPAFDDMRGYPPWEALLAPR
jgi:tetratricopeptide (TPR) repeat protein